MEEPTQVKYNHESFTIQGSLNFVKTNKLRIKEFDPNSLIYQNLFNIIMEVPLLAQVEKDYILEDFPNKINDFCEEYSRVNKVPPEMMSTIAVNFFKDKVSPTKIRQHIDEKFKQSHRVNNAKQKKQDTSQKWNKLQKIARDLGFKFVEKIHQEANPFYEATVFLTKSDEE